MSRSQVKSVAMEQWWNNEATSKERRQDKKQPVLKPC